MSRTDEQLVTDVREAVRTAPLGQTVALDEVVAVGRRRVRSRRALGAGGLLVAAAVAGGVALSLNGVGPLGAAPFGVAGEGGRGPSVTVTEAPDSSKRLYDAFDARLEALGMPTEGVGWASGPTPLYFHEGRTDLGTVESALAAGALDLGFTLETGRYEDAIDVTGDLCQEMKTVPLDCSQTELSDGAQLLRLTTPATPTQPAELAALHVLRPRGYVRVLVQVTQLTPNGVIEFPPVDEEQLLEIATDPALQW